WRESWDAPNPQIPSSRENSNIKFQTSIHKRHLRTCQEKVRMRAVWDLELGDYLLGRLLHQLFRNLHGVERGAFQQLIARNPEAKAVFQSDVFADAADLTVVLLRRVKRHRILFLLRVIHDIKAGR